MASVFLSHPVTVQSTGTTSRGYISSDQTVDLVRYVVPLVHQPSELKAYFGLRVSVLTINDIIQSVSQNCDFSPAIATVTLAYIENV